MSIKSKFHGECLMLQRSLEQRQYIYRTHEEHLEDSYSSISILNNFLKQSLTET